ncbi:unnamed protein product [Phytophthora fragariaefolia]|uniref:Unnamed protein product n=1 Tax=Phytophthora fragariaefolia TaxID=1490495 RepID=A0A9W6WTM9_9STRA|nr:unnamed protein product [Phytophthora fragariaefolia]
MQGFGVVQSASARYSNWEVGGNGANDYFIFIFIVVFFAASELPTSPDRRVKHTIKINLTNPSETIFKRAVILPKVPPIPTATMWTALSKNYEVEDEPQLKFLPYFGDDDEEDVVSEFYQIK